MSEHRPERDTSGIPSTYDGPTAQYAKDVPVPTDPAQAEEINPDYVPIPFTPDHLRGLGKVARGAGEEASPASPQSIEDSAN